MASDSSIFYKFRSGTDFESLPLPGTSATLFDVKRAIVKAKRLDKPGNIEFDLNIKNANTSEEYSDDSMLLSRGSRLIVQRLPAARGMGLLDRIAKSELGVAPTGSIGNQRKGAVASNVDHSRFFEIKSRDEDEEFLSASKIKMEEEDNSELEKLQTVMDLYKHNNPTSINISTAYSGSSGYVKARYSADPEIRSEEQKNNAQQTKKRATGIPRTFLNFIPPEETSSSAAGSLVKEEENVIVDENTAGVTIKLQPNSLGFQELITRGGGKSTSHTAKNLDYALQLTNERIPDYLKCGICGTLVKDAMLLPWDPEGRTCCEKCIRTALNQSGFRCPLTGMEGVSPDDLIPNIGLRKAAERFQKDVWEKVDLIEKEQQDMAQADAAATAESLKDSKTSYDGGTEDKGTVVSSGKKDKKRKKDSDSWLVGDDDDFGGDVFAVAPKSSVANDEIGIEEKKPISDDNNIKAKPMNEKSTDKIVADVVVSDEKNTELKNEKSKAEILTKDKTTSLNPNNAAVSTTYPGALSALPEKSEEARKVKNRGPPPGYSFGVAPNFGQKLSIPPPPPPPPPKPKQTHQTTTPQTTRNVPFQYQHYPKSARFNSAQSKQFGQRQEAFPQHSRTTAEPQSTTVQPTAENPTGKDESGSKVNPQVVRDENEANNDILGQDNKRARMNDGRARKSSDSDKLAPPPPSMRHPQPYYQGRQNYSYHRQQQPLHPHQFQHQFAHGPPHQSHFRGGGRGGGRQYQNDSRWFGRSNGRGFDRGGRGGNRGRWHYNQAPMPQQGYYQPNYPPNPPQY